MRQILFAWKNLILTFLETGTTNRVGGQQNHRATTLPGIKNENDLLYSLTVYIIQRERKQYQVHAFDRAAMQAKRPASALNFPNQHVVAVQQGQGQQGQGQRGQEQEQQNNAAMSPPPPRKKKKSLHKGVIKQGKGYQAKIMVDCEYKYLGVYDTSVEAAHAYDRAAIQAGRSASTLNFPSSSSSSSSNHCDYKGVYKNRNKYVAQLYAGGKAHYLGKFDTPLEAAQTYDRVAIQAGRLTSKLKFPDQAQQQLVVGVDYKGVVQVSVCVSLFHVFLFLFFC